MNIFLNLYLKKSNELVTREVQCIICSFIHQMFIDNSSLAEVVHFQVILFIMFILFVKFD